MSRRGDARHPAIDLVVAATALALAVGACSSGDDDGRTAPPEASTPEVTAGVDPATATTVAATGDPSATESTVGSTERSSPTSTVPSPPTTFQSAAEDLGLVPIEQLTAVRGGGPRPLLEWRAVEGAVRYHVFVLAPSGSVYWGWETGDTVAAVGGTPRLDDDAPGPAIVEGMTWSVSAVDSTGHVIALSPHRPIGP